MTTDIDEFLSPVERIITELELDMIARKLEFPPPFVHRMPCGYTIGDIEELATRLREVVSKMKRRHRKHLDLDTHQGQ